MMTTKREDILTTKNFILFAAQNYNNHRVLDVNEFYDDLLKFKYLKKLFTKYNKTGIIKERLILNHIISIFNVFNIEAAVAMCIFKLDESSYSALKAFLLYLKYIKENDLINIQPDPYVNEKLKEI